MKFKSASSWHGEGERAISVLHWTVLSEACCDHTTKRQGIGYAEVAASDASIFVKLGTFACLMGGTECRQLKGSKMSQLRSETFTYNGRVD